MGLGRLQWQASDEGEPEQQEREHRLHGTRGVGGARRYLCVVLGPGATSGISPTWKRPRLLSSSCYRCCAGAPPPWLAPAETETRLLVTGLASRSGFAVWRGGGWEEERQRRGREEAEKRQRRGCSLHGRGPTEPRRIWRSRASVSLRFSFAFASPIGGPKTLFYFFFFCFVLFLPFCCYPRVLALPTIMGFLCER
jgi:hypothetical protein